MRIPDAPPSGASSQIQPVATPAGNAEHAAAPSSEHDCASIGAVASAASKSLEAADQKIAELRAQYLNGTYQVDSDKVSSKIIAEHLQK